MTEPEDDPQAGSAKPHAGKSETGEPVEGPQKAPGSGMPMGSDRGETTGGSESGMGLFFEALREMAFPGDGATAEDITTNGSTPGEDSFEVQALRWLEEAVELENQRLAGEVPTEGDSPEAGKTPGVSKIPGTGETPGDPSGAEGINDGAGAWMEFLRRMAPPGMNPASSGDTARLGEPPSPSAESSGGDPYVDALKKIAFPDGFGAGPGPAAGSEPAGGPSADPTDDGFEIQALRWLEQETARLSRGEPPSPSAESSGGDPYVDALKKIAFPDGFGAGPGPAAGSEPAGGPSADPTDDGFDLYVQALKKLAFPIPSAMPSTMPIPEIDTGEFPTGEDGEADDLRWLEQEAKDLWEEKTVQEEDPWVGAMKVVIRRLEGGPPPEVTPTPLKATIIAWSSDLDRAYAALILATTAAAAGMRVTVFATFWGLLLLKKPNRGVTGTDWMTKLLARLAPGGPDRLRLSRSNLGGLGTRIIKELFRQSRIVPLQTFLWMAIDLGVRFIPCQMTMDAFGLKREDLIDEVDVPAGAAFAVSEAAESAINWFI